jgi:HEPN domain-containing protein
VNRKQLQRLAKERLKDSKALLAKKRWAAAYYFSGYVIECGLKACLLKYLDDTGIIFRDRKYLSELTDCWTHDLGKLVKMADLESAFGTARGAHPNLEQFWGVVKDWKETSRYEEKTEDDARAMLDAVDNKPDGVFLWIQELIFDQPGTHRLKLSTDFGHQRDDGSIREVRLETEPVTLTVRQPTADDEAVVKILGPHEAKEAMVGWDWSELGLNALREIVTK